MNLRRLAPAATVLALMAPSAAAQTPRLGTITFPNSGAKAAQASFIRGVLYLHSFEFGPAGDAFREAQQADPGFALAYWGEAMSYNHPLWGEWDDAAARAALRRLAPTPGARRAKAPTAREQMYLDAVEALWGAGPKPVRDTAYALAMEQLVRAYPDDDEARAFWALSILGLSGTTRVVPSYMRGAAIAEEVLRRNPNHPGAVHYIIHSFDDPVHAPLGLSAARAYSKIAPDAAHAQHMTTHIFLAMGMWDEVVSQNEIAANLTSWSPGHYTYWLGYGLLQQGRWDAAREQLERARSEMGSPARPRQWWYLAAMRAQYVITTQRWADSVLDWPMEIGDDREATAIDAFALGYAALRRGDRRTAAAQAGRLQTAADSSDDPATHVLSLNLAAAISAASGSSARALDMLDDATRIEDSLPAAFGPPDIVKPSWELLGELLLAAGRSSRAQTAFTHALTLAPKRALSLRGLVAAASATGDRAVAVRARQDLAAVWHSADAAVRDSLVAR